MCVDIGNFFPRSKKGHAGEQMCTCVCIYEDERMKGNTYALRRVDLRMGESSIVVEAGKVFPIGSFIV